MAASTVRNRPSREFRIKGAADPLAGSIRQQFQGPVFFQSRKIQFQDLFGRLADDRDAGQSPFENGSHNGCCAGALFSDCGKGDFCILYNVL